jgi:hypothetical protein
MPDTKNNLHKRILTQYFIQYIGSNWEAILIEFTLRHYRSSNMCTILFVKTKIPVTFSFIFANEKTLGATVTIPYVHFHSIYVNKQCIITKMNEANR